MARAHTVSNKVDDVCRFVYRIFARSHAHHVPESPIERAIHFVTHQFGDSGQCQIAVTQQAPSPVQPWKKPNPKFEKLSGSTLPDCAKMAYRFRFQQAKSSMLKLPRNVRPAGRAKEH
jgi:hypothetical protein|nr:hypothetical protein [Ferrovum sp.]